MEFINPWSSQQYKDYAKLRDQFGIGAFDFELPDAPPLFRRGVIFGHRGFEYVYDSIIHKQPFAVLTGLMPSGRMHFGHKMTIDQVRYYQEQGGDVHIAVADIEAYASRGISLEKAREIAVEEYVTNYIALGLDPEKTEVYFQSQRREVKDIAWKLGKKVNMSEFMAIYGFGGEANMTHVFSPLIQVGDILHVQLEKYGGARPTIVPVGVDQDPHIRLTRDIAARWRMFSFSMQKEGLGVFYKGEDAAKVLGRLKKHLEERGYENVKMNVPYKALYLTDRDEKDVISVDRDVMDYERELNEFAFFSPAATYHRLITGLTGSKMSSSHPDSAIFLSDSPAEAKKKVMRALTGGRATLDEHRRLGGEPDKCAVYEMFVYHLIDDDAYLREIHDTCINGTRICGKCKKEAANIIEEWLKEFHVKREQARDAVNDVLSTE
ncbi:MAG: tryptophan--tRNA ligase [Euryarchaeota archaeon]|nr:tryptophan--tRNA ligase [Euryarchaeota archaeon]